MLNARDEDRSALPLEIGLLFILFLAPAAFGSAYPWASMALCAWLFFLFFCYPQALNKFRSLPRLSQWGFLGIFFFLIFQRFFTSLNAAATETELLKWLAFAAAFLLLQLLTRNSLFRLGLALILLAVIESAYGLYEELSGHEKVLWQAKEFHRGFVTGTYLNRNHFAGLLELCLGVHLGLLFAACHKRNFKFILMIALFLALTLVAFFKTGSRAGIASFSLAFLFLAPFLVKREGNLIFFALSLVAVAGASLAGWSAFWPRFFASWQGPGAWEGRITVWKDALRILRDHLWMGSGLGSFEWVFPAYQSEPLTWGWRHAHNDYLELLVTLGLPAFLILMAAFMVLASRCVKKIGQLPDTSFPLAWGSLVSVASLCLHAAADFNLAIPANAFLLIFLLGLVYRLVAFESVA